MTQYGNLDHQHHDHHHQSIPNKIRDPADPKSMEQVKSKSTDPVEPKFTKQVNPKCIIQIDNKSSDQVSTSPPSVKVPDTENICTIGFFSLVIIGTLLISNFMALKILVIIEYSFFAILFLIGYLHVEFWPNYIGSPLLISDALKDIEQKPNVNCLVSFFFISLDVIIHALIIKELWILKLVSIFIPLVSLLSVLAEKPVEAQSAVKESQVEDVSED